MIKHHWSLWPTINNLEILSSMNLKWHPPPSLNFTLLKVSFICGILTTTSKKLLNFTLIVCISHSGMTGPWPNHQISSPLSHCTTGIKCSGTTMPSGISSCLEAPKYVDFQFSVLYPHTGFWHFREGILKLKQVTGCEQWDMQCYMIPVIMGAVPKCFLIALCVLADFHYLAQAPQITEEICGRIKAALAEFHQHKDAVISAGAQKGWGNKVINNWHISKLKFMQSIVSNIQNNGAAIQWSTDATEHAVTSHTRNSKGLHRKQNIGPPQMF